MAGSKLVKDYQVGDVVEYGTYEFTQDKIIDFAKEYDPQPFHLDPEAAKDTFFEGLAASGWQASGVAMRLMVESLDLAKGIVGIEVKVKWSNPIRPGDVMSVKTEFKSIDYTDSNPDQAVCNLVTTAYNQAGKKMIILDSKVLLSK